MVAMRLDPCGTDNPCTAEIRLIWQVPLPGNSSTGQPVLNVNTGIHSFYRLERGLFLQFSRELIQLRKATSPSTRGVPLDIHPAFIKDGIAGRFGRGLKSLLPKFIGERNLYRMNARGFSRVPTPALAFVDFRRDGGRWRAHDIPGTKEPVQRVFEKGSSPYTYWIVFEPFPGNLSPAGSEFLKIGSAEFFKLASSRKVRRTADEFGSIQNPLRTPKRDEINCAVCHIAPNAERWFRLANPQLNLYSAPYRYRSNEFNLKDVSITGWWPPAMSYQSGSVSIHPRAIAESAEVAKQMNRLFE